MKKLLFACALFLGAAPMVHAQEASTTNEASPEEYKTMIENHYKVKFREMAYKSLELTEDEIIKFDPLYSEYIAQKMDIADRRNKLVEKYRDEMMEDDDAEEKADERADFIENYWETQIKEMELKKDYFDRFEDIVSNEQAINFFLLEEKAQSRMEESSLIEIVPMMIEVREYDPAKKKMKKNKDSSMNWQEKDDAMSDKTDSDRMANNSAWTDTDDDAKMKEKSNENWSSKTTDTASDQTMSDKEMTDKEDKNWTAKGNAAYSSNTTGLNTFNEWINKEGNSVSLNHRYTSNGLESLVGAIEAVASQHGIDASAWSDHKERIMTITKELQKNPNATDHADMAREAFEASAKMINAIQDQKGTDKTKGFASQVTSAAHAINPDRLMTKQANDIYAFFGYANQALQELSNAANYKSSSASAQNK